jgi:hypothetical protein
VRSLTTLGVDWKDEGDEAARVTKIMVGQGTIVDGEHAGYAMRGGHSSYTKKRSALGMYDYDSYEKQTKL